MSDFRRNSRYKNNKKNRLKNIQDIFSGVNINFRGISLDSKNLPTIILIVVIVSLLIGYIIFSVRKYNDKQKELAYREQVTEEAQNYSEEANNVAITDEDIKQNNDTRIKLGVVGNIYCQKTIEDDNNNDYSNLFSEIKDDIQNKDLSIGTLSTNFVSSEETNNYNSSSEFLSSLASTGFDVLDLSSTHAFDYNENGLEETKSKVETNGMSTIGICSEANSNGQLKKDVKGIKVGFLSYIYLDKNTGISDGEQNKLYVNSWNSQKASDQIRALKKDTDYIIVDLNLSAISSEDEINSIIKNLIDDNVDMVVCTNSNVVKRLDIQKRQDGGQTFISYGLGNFLSSSTDLSLMLEVQLTKSVDDGKVYLAKINYDPIYSFKDQGYKLVNVREKVKEYESKVDINEGKSSQTLEKQDEMVYNVLSQQLVKIEKIIGSEEQ